MFSQANYMVKVGIKSRTSHYGALFYHSDQNKHFSGTETQYMPLSGVEPWVSTLVLPYTCRTTVQDFNRVNCFEKIRARARGARKMPFSTLGRVPALAH